MSQITYSGGRINSITEDAVRRISVLARQKRSAEGPEGPDSDQALHRLCKAARTASPQESVHEGRAHPPATKSGSLRILRCSGMLVLMPSITVISSSRRMRAMRFVSIAAVDDDLGDQRIVVRRDRALGVRQRFDANARAAGHAEDVNDARARGRTCRDPRH